MITDRHTIEAMLRYGGPFEQALARAYLAGDGEEQAAIREAFPGRWSHYSALAQDDQNDAGPLRRRK